MTGVLALGMVALLGATDGAGGTAGEDRAALEDAMFGGEAEPAPEPVAEVGGASGEDRAALEDGMFGGGEEPATGEGPAAAPTDSEFRLSQAIDEITETVDVGGQLFMRLDYNAAPTRYSVDGAGEIVEDETFSSPNLLDVYLDARPMDQIRGYARGRLRYDFTVNASSRVFGRPVSRDSVLLDQLWLKFDILRFAYLTIGQQPIRWGSARFWNPTDFMNSQLRDPLAVFDERTGVSLVKIHIPVESWGWNFYAVANLSGATRPENVGLGLRAEVLWDVTEFALSTAWRRDQPFKLGFDVSSALWYFDVKAEFALTYDERRPFWAGSRLVDLDAVNDPASLPALLDIASNPENITVIDGALYRMRSRSRQDQWILQGSLNAEIEIRYNDEGDTLLLGAEYFYNDYGYKTSTVYPWLATQGDFNPLTVGRHYVAAYATLFAPYSWNETSFVLSALGNLSDLSFLTRLDYSVRFLRKITLNAYMMAHFGEARGSFTAGIEPVDVRALAAGLPAGTLEQIGIDDAAAIALERGQPDAVFEAGVGLRIAF